MQLECGAQYTVKAEGMFRDLNSSKELQEQYLDSTQSRHNEGIQPTVLTQGFWPSPAFPECRLPPDVEPLKQSFEAFFFDQFSSRRLTWITEKVSAGGF